MDRTAAACVGSVALHGIAWVALTGLLADDRHPVTAAPLAIEIKAVEPAPAPAPAEKAPIAKAKATSRPKAVRARPPAPATVETPVVATPESVGVTPASGGEGNAGGEGKGETAGPGGGLGGTGAGGQGTGESPLVLHPHVDAHPSEDYTRLVPPYSDAAIDSDVNGAVSLRLEIDETGRVTKATILKPLGHGLDELAIETAKKYRFAPARDENGKPVRTMIGWNVVWESYWKRLVVQTVSGHPNCAGHGPMNLGETHPEYMDCDHPAGAFTLSENELPRP